MNQSQPDLGIFAAFCNEYKQVVSHSSSVNRLRAQLSHININIY